MYILISYSTQLINSSNTIDYREEGQRKRKRDREKDRQRECEREREADLKNREKRTKVLEDQFTLFLF